MKKLTPPQLLILSFLCVIILGTAVLSLPMATSGTEKLSITDSLFTAASATCVTGLVVKDTGTTFTPFGKWVIFALFQAGGLGIMTFSTLFAVLLGRKIGFRETDIIKGTLDNHNILGLKKLITYILGITFAAEGLGALFLFVRWKVSTDWGVWEILEKSIFHSVSAFCNAGFSLFSNNLASFQADPYINLIMIVLIFLGGIGFIVIMDAMGLLFKKGPAKRVSLQTKIVLTVSVALIILGAVLLLVFERNNALKGMTAAERGLGAIFHSVAARTAGFNTLDIGSFTAPSLMSLIFLMFIGASPGSTGGGIKTCTFAVVMALTFGMMKNRKKVMFFGRSVPKQVIREALVIFFLALAWIFIGTMVLTVIGGSFTRGDNVFIKALFEIVSAFGTVGLSTGITGTLSGAGKILVIVTMFAGRVGPLTLALAVASRERKDNYFYPEENLMVG
ncbi:MAG: potassium transporter TrkG [Candidatus Aadella gelida]|nr:potassium transporter TrkG [Candidatus Aadella gelida]